MRIALLTTDSREHFKEYECPNPYFGTAPEALLQGFSHQSDIQIHVLSCTQQPMVSPEKLAENIWFHSLPVPKNGWLRTGYLGCIRAVREKLKEIQPDLVHAQGTERDCALNAVLSPYPRVLTIHGNLRLIKKQVGFAPFSALWFQSFLEGFVVPRFDGIICITNYTREAVEHEVKQTWVVPNAVDLAFLELGERRLADLKESIGDGLDFVPRVLVVANIDARKNQNDFIRALDQLAERITFQVRFFGKCGDDDYGREFVALVAARPWCHYGGMVGREDLRTEFLKATMLALPTHEDNCPMVVLEAQGSGVPVIASKVGGVPDLVEDGVTGLLVNPRHPSTINDAVSRLLTDYSLRVMLASNAYIKAVTHYHPLIIANKHLKIYEQVLGEKE